MHAEQTDGAQTGGGAAASSGPSAPDHDLETTESLELDFDKLASVVATGERLIPVVLQHVDDGEVLFVGYANHAALYATFTERRAVLWSTSRNELWRKGETSGDHLDLVEIRVNCEQNSLLYLVRPVNHGVCHTTDSSGEHRPSCYYRTIHSVRAIGEAIDALGALGFRDGLD